MFSKSTEYALRATIFIAQKSSEETKLGLDDIAKGIKSPRSFTAKILQQLTAGNKIVSSTRGPRGGFFMTENARMLPVKTILMAMEEDDVLDKCVLGLKKCSDIKPCPMHNQYKTIKQQLKTLFVSKSIQDLADEMETSDRYL